MGNVKEVITMNIEAAPIGRFIRKIQRQPSTNISSSMPARVPPITGPNSEEDPNTARNRP